VGRAVGKKSDAEKRREKAMVGRGGGRQGGGPWATEVRRASEVEIRRDRDPQAPRAAMGAELRPCTVVVGPGELRP